ncbi:MAG TPA: hypothetical protein ENH82_17785 [bacterium]|nr:hypothetical protein [bacterium]
MIKANSRAICYTIISLLLIIIHSGCSNEISSYDEIEKSGKIESVAMENYAEFFKAVNQLGSLSENSQETVPDSSHIKKATQLTVKLSEDIKQFPSTVQSRIALDALSYCAGNLAMSADFSIREVSEFWQYTLMKTLISTGQDFMKSADINESAHLQLLKAIHRGIGSNATEELVMDIIPIVGAAPSLKILEYCKTDTLVLKRIHDLILYTRSLQKVDPPVWMLSGAWFLAIEFEGWPTIFITLVPLMIDDVPYLTFKDNNMGEIYAAVFDDPVPTDKSKWESWLTRGNAIMSSLVFDNSIIERVRNSGLSTYDTHNFYHDYLLHTDVDTTKKEFYISFLRKKAQESAFEFTGMDSIAVIFNSSQIAKPDGDITTLTTTRTTGASMIGDQFFPGRSSESKAYLIQLGTHDNKLISAYQQKQTMPELEVETISVND